MSVYFWLGQVRSGYSVYISVGNVTSDYVRLGHAHVISG
jgi:hypothetical protein